MGDQDPEDEQHRKAALLTPRQRKFLLGSCDLSDRGERAARSRIRDRINEGTIDFSILLHHLDKEDRRKALSLRSDSQYDSVVDSLAFFYLVIDDTRADFDKVLERAIRKAEKDRAQVLTEFDLTVEVEDKSPEDFRERLHSGSQNITFDEIEQHLEEGTVTKEEVRQYFDQSSLTIGNDFVESFFNDDQ